VHWLRETFETLYAVVLAIGLMGGVWGAGYYLFGRNGMITRISSNLLDGGHGGPTLLAVMAALLGALAIMIWLPRLPSSRPARALLGALVVGGYAFLFRAFSVGI
jgi:hypothetical protein